MDHCKWWCRCTPGMNCVHCTGPGDMGGLLRRGSTTNCVPSWCREFPRFTPQTSLILEAIYRSALAVQRAGGTTLDCCVSIHFSNNLFGCNLFWMDKRFNMPSRSPSTFLSSLPSSISPLLPSPPCQTSRKHELLKTSMSNTTTTTPTLRHAGRSRLATLVLCTSCPFCTPSALTRH